MKLIEITNQHRFDFWGIFQCEHCGTKATGRGYADDNYHKNVLPFVACPNPDCKKQSKEGPEKTSYDGFKIIVEKPINDKLGGEEDALRDPNQSKT